MSPSCAQPKTIVLQTYDVGNTSEDMSVMAAKEKGLTSATYCAAGNPNMTNCANRTGLPRISMHYFPKDKTLRQKLIWFVRIHRKDFVLKKRQLCVPPISTKVVSILWALQFTMRVED